MASHASDSAASPHPSALARLCALHFEVVVRMELNLPSCTTVRCPPAKRHAYPLWPALRKPMVSRSVYANDDKLSVTCRHCAVNHCTSVPPPKVTAMSLFVSCSLSLLQLRLTDDLRPLCVGVFTNRTALYRRVSALRLPTCLSKLRHHKTPEDSTRPSTRLHSLLQPIHSLTVLSAKSQYCDFAV